MGTGDENREDEEKECVTEKTGKLAVIYWPVGCRQAGVRVVGGGKPTLHVVKPALSLETLFYDSMHFHCFYNLV